MIRNDNRLTPVSEAEQQRLTITSQQTQLLIKYQRELEVARDRLNAVAEAILAGHGVVGGRLIALDVDTNSIVVAPNIAVEETRQKESAGEAAG